MQHQNMIQYTISGVCPVSILLHVFQWEISTKSLLIQDNTHMKSICLQYINVAKKQWYSIYFYIQYTELLSSALLSIAVATASLLLPPLHIDN